MSVLIFYPSKTSMSASNLVMSQTFKTLRIVQDLCLSLARSAFLCHSKCRWRDKVLFPVNLAMKASANSKDNRCINNNVTTAEEMSKSRFLYRNKPKCPSSLLNGETSQKSG